METEDMRTDGQTLIDYRLNQIEKKLDTVTDILLQTQAQELRISTLEKGICELKNNLNDFIQKTEKQKSKNVDRWLTPLISTFVSVLVSGFLAFILVKVGLK